MKLRKTKKKAFERIREDAETFSFFPSKYKEDLS